MSNLLAKGQQLLTRLMQRSAAPTGRLTYYPVSGGDPIDLTGKAWVGRTLFTRLPKEGGGNVEWGDRDYLVPVAHLPAEPQRGDRIVEEIDGTDVTFEAIEPLSEPAWRYSDPGRTVYRIHMKEQAV